MDDPSNCPPPQIRQNATTPPPPPKKKKGKEKKIDHILTYMGIVCCQPFVCMSLRKLRLSGEGETSLRRWWCETLKTSD